jgi:Pyridoxamine 5'-phosphate oxidase
MAQTFAEIDSELAQWIARQHVFFVATAPGGRDGLINCSPKGLDSLRVLGPRTVAYLDLTGSGAETIAHVKDNGRIVIMLCAFDGPPRIVRLQGHGSVIAPTDARFAEYVGHFRAHPGMRAVILIDVTRISDSCGYAVPLMDFRAEREALTRWAEKKEPAGVVDYQREHNATSLDGLPAVDWLDSGHGRTEQ